MEQQHEEQEHEVYGGEIPDEGEMDADVDMTRADEEDLQDPNSKVPFPFLSINIRVCVRVCGHM